MLPKVPARVRTQRLCVDAARRNRGSTTRDSRKVRRKATEKGKTTRKSSKANATSVARQITCRRIADLTNECIRSWQKKDSQNRMHRNGKHRFECIGDRSSAGVRKRSHNSHWDRFVCCSDAVPKEGGGRLPDAPNAKQIKKLQTSVRQASAGSWCAKKVQVKLKDVNHRVADTHRALMGECQR